MLRRIAVTLAVGLVSATVLAAPSANATTPGGDGKIAFVRANQIFTMTKTGGTVKQLTTVGKNYRPKWAPDGKHIAYIQEDAAGKRNVFKMTATGTNKTKVTNTGVVRSNPTWSPDGTTLAFTSGGTPGDSCSQVTGAYGCDLQLYTIKATAPFGNPVARVGWLSYLWDGGHPDAIGPISADRFISWSPDGTKIALYCHISGVWDHSITEYTLATGENREILVNGSDGSTYQDWSDLNYAPNGAFGYATVDHTQEYEDGSPAIVKLVFAGFASQQGDKSGAPSPSGTRMAFVRLTGTTPNVWTATMTGAQRRQIVSNGYQPDWQPLL